MKPVDAYFCERNADWTELDDATDGEQQDGSDYLCFNEQPEDFSELDDCEPTGTGG